MQRYGIVIGGTILIVALLLLVQQGTATDGNGEKAQLESLEQKISYIVGANMGHEFRQNGVDIDVDALRAGLADALAGNEPQLTDAQMQEAMAAFQQQMMQRQQQQMEEAQALARTNREQGQAFLKENAEKEGVVTTDSGLQYKVIEAGDGPKPKATDTVRVHYHGTLINGEVFDSSRKRGEPLTIPVGNVIPGWVEALQLMPVGSKWQLVIPGNLAYGERGGPGGPNSTLIFEVELLGIE